ncbi:nucleotidyltransferase domain-containing protein [Anabaena aphanizomenioides LEGE 00250]|jgi:predicted nucleotidyltransferase|uniref:Nucleotidyltransferase domain-containing protein n=1 Tax=Sphaerospermopsis aphanizomenoides LEGE 00250 TaxID=2777972 RepID=A0ABR9VI34_9CYAN|nr:nucleotidyltransferase domain-containing protein [Sphaerospermopsis aphanizomenoides]MBE9238158.1 nucleotidyltransferase domain-containing protein [Sphaerospermopsis aphanizomenoides LEGE 00250]
MKHPKLEQIMQELCDNLLATYQNQLIAVILFGSQARGDATPDSDFDVLIVLKDVFQTTKEIEKIGFFLSPLCLKYSVVISNLFYTLNRFEKEETMLIKNIKKEA